jgi:uncharacterized alkaline shock family protein YloU
MSDSPSLDTKEFEMPKTVYSHDIESRVIQIIILHCINSVEGVFLMGGNLIDTLLGRDVERMKGIFVEQDSKSHTVKVRIEVNVRYGEAIPLKSAEIQNCIVEEITKLTGLHVACVHVIVKGLLLEQDEKKVQEKEQELLEEFPNPFLEREEEVKVN